MAEGVSASKVGSEIAEHSKRDDPHQSRDRLLSVLEALLLSVVALCAAWSGFAAAKWSTESRDAFAEASADRTRASRADLDAMELRNFDSSTFESWFAAFIVGNEEAMTIAERRFRPAFKVAFDAWRATNPEKNANAPRGPTFMPQYRQPERATADALNREAAASFAAGASAGATADKYVRTTVFLATVLFLVGISTHFPLLPVRYALVGLAGVLLVVSLAMLSQLPRPPG